MTRSELKTIIDKYQDSERQISELDQKYGIDLFSNENGFWNKKEDVINSLFTHLLGKKGVDLFWDYVFEQSITFEELCHDLNLPLDNPEATIDEVFDALDDYENANNIGKLATDFYQDY